jgi:DNA modification methylase
MSKDTPDRLQIEYFAPQKLRPRTGNAKVHSKQQIKKVAKSIARFGFVRPVLISDEKELIAGHACVAAAIHLGLDFIPAVRLSRLTPVERLAYSLADNRLAEFSYYDRELLALQFEELTNLDFDEIEVTGFALGDIDIRLDEAAEKKTDPGGPDDELPAPRKRTVSRPGDCWILGQHRLVCGDATTVGDYQRLMDGQQADMVFTDPPWNLPTRYFSGLGRHRHSDFAMAHGEKSEAEFTSFLSSFLQLSKQVSKQGAIVFVFMDWRHLFELLSAARAQELPLKNLVVWAKRNAGMGTFYRSQHELIAILKSGDAAHLNNFELGQHGRHRSNLWQYAGGNSFHNGRDEELAMHPTCKPVDLVADAIRDVSRRGAIVLDPFAGSGSTLIAAEKTGRRAYALEIDPVFCDVIVRRFEAYTGKLAQLEGEGMTFSEAENARAIGRKEVENPESAGDVP